MGPGDNRFLLWLRHLLPGIDGRSRELTTNREQQKKSVVAILAIVLLFSFSFSIYNPSVKADNTNLTPEPSAWMTSNTGMDWGIGSSDAVGMATYPVTHGGQTCIQMQPNSFYIASGVGGPALSEIDSYGFSINVGDRIVYSAYFYTDASSTGNNDPTSGAVLGLDLYGANGRLCEISTPNGVATWPNYPGSHTQCVVTWNSGGWVYVSINFVVQSTYIADPWGAYGSGGQAVTPIAFIPWICEDYFGSSPNSETAHIYVYGAELQVNPSGSPTPSPTPVHTATPRPSATPTPNPSASPTPTPSPTPNPTPTPLPIHKLDTSNTWTANIASLSTSTFNYMQVASTLTGSWWYNASISILPSSTVYFGLINSTVNNPNISSSINYTGMLLAGDFQTGNNGLYLDTEGTGVGGFQPFSFEDSCGNGGELNFAVYYDATTNNFGIYVDNILTAIPTHGLTYNTLGNGQRWYFYAGVSATGTGTLTQTLTPVFALTPSGPTPTPNMTPTPYGTINGGGMNGNAGSSSSSGAFFGISFGLVGGAAAAILIAMTIAGFVLNMKKYRGSSK